MPDWKQHPLTIPAAMLAAALGLSTLGLYGWIAAAGGKIRHQEVCGEVLPLPADDPGSPHIL